MLDKIISPCQSAFIPGRWIDENSILVNEILHTMRRKRSGNGLVGIKVDMMRAYDRVDWGFLSRLLAHFGFSSKINDLVMGCISVHSVDLILNGSVYRKIC